MGDGTMYWYLQEIIVLPEYQKKGVGTRIVNHLINYARENSKTCPFTTIQQRLRFVFALSSPIEQMKKVPN